MKPKIEVIESRLFAGDLADEIIASLNEVITAKGRAVIALSGGSTPAQIYRSLALKPRVSEVDWSKVVLLWGDERWVPHTDEHSNYRMVAETLLHNLPKPGPEIVPVNTALESVEAGAADYSEKVATTLSRSDGFIDIVLLGMGEDGHIASIFPDAARPDHNLAYAAKNPNDGSERVTLSPGLLFGAKKIIFIVSGAKKASMLQRIFAKEGTPESIPARLYESAMERVTWFLDSAAGNSVRA